MGLSTAVQRKSPDDIALVYWRGKQYTLLPCDFVWHVAPI
ncbi:hypothetical protein PF003_g19754 [Phytophthora fragariae]|nr:hypothetical protein PF003_g19754 [Phytophthora fragariae]